MLELFSVGLKPGLRYQLIRKAFLDEDCIDFFIAFIQSAKWLPLDQTAYSTLCVQLLTIPHHFSTTDGQDYLQKRQSGPMLTLADATDERAARFLAESQLSPLCTSTLCARTDQLP